MSKVLGMQSWRCLEPQLQQRFIDQTFDTLVNVEIAHPPHLLPEAVNTKQRIRHKSEETKTVG